MFGHACPLPIINSHIYKLSIPTFTNYQYIRPTLTAHIYYHLHFETCLSALLKRHVLFSMEFRQTRFGRIHLLQLRHPSWCKNWFATNNSERKTASKIQSFENRQKKRYGSETNVLEKAYPAAHHFERDVCVCIQESHQVQS